MPKDVIITPASGLIDFQGNTGISSATIQLDGSNNLNISNPGGNLTLGDTSRDIYIGDGINNVDIVFEQDGEIRGLTNKTVSLGQTDSYIKIVGPLKDYYNNVGIAGSILVSTGAGVSWTNTVSASRLTLNGANDTATGGGQLYLNGATGNRIDFNVNGVAAPTTTTRSAGTKLVLYPNLGGSTVDYALGIEGDTLWYSIPQAQNTRQHRWYAGTTQLADLKGSGELVIGSTSLTGTSNQKLQVTGGAYVSGNVGIGTTNPTYKVQIDDTAATGAGLLVRGGGSGSDIAKFERNIGGAGSLTINCSSSSPQLQFNSSLNTFAVGVFGNDFQIADTSTLGTYTNVRLAINSSGYVGIGTTNPQYIFTVTDTGTPATTGLTNCLADFTTTANSYGQINLRNTSTGTNASSDIVITADNGTDSSNFIDLGINNSGFSVGSWTINGPTDGYLYSSDTNLSIGVAAANKYLSFFTGGTLISNERMRVNAAGVGIGTTNPGSTLDVRGSSPTIRAQDNTSNYSILLNSNSLTGPRIQFGQNADNSFMEFGAYSNFNNLDTKNRDLKIFSTAAPDAFILRQATGNIGIGTTNPGEKLHLGQGRIRLDEGWQITWLSTAGTQRARILGDSANNFTVETGASNTEVLRVTSSSRVGIVTTNPQATLQVKDALAFETTNTTTTNTNQVAVDTFATATFRSAKYQAQITCPGQISVLGGITTGGRGYTAGTFNVTFTTSSGNGSAAQGTLVVSNGTVGQISVSSGGSGYTAGDVLTASGGSGLQVSVGTTSGTGAILTLGSITSAGIGYTAGVGVGTTTLTFLGGTGTGAIGLATILDGVITSSTLLQQPTTGTGGTTYYSGSNYSTASVLSVDRTTLTNTITTIASSGISTFTSLTAHGLFVNDIIRSSSTSNGLTAGTDYYVVSTPTTTTFTLGTSLGVAALFTAGTSLSIGFFRNSANAGGQVNYTNAITGVSTNHQVSDLMVLHNGTTADFVEYATIANDDILGTFAADISGANARLLFTPTYPNNNIKVARQAITV